MKRRRKAEVQYPSGYEGVLRLGGDEVAWVCARCGCLVALRDKHDEVCR